MPTQEEWLAMRKAASIRYNTQMEEQTRLRQMVSQSMQELKMADPRWNLFSEHIIRELERIKAKQHLVVQDLTNHSVFRSAEAYGQLCLENAGTARYIEALEWCLGLIDKLINNGKQDNNHEQ